MSTAFPCGERRSSLPESPCSQRLSGGSTFRSWSRGRACGEGAVLESLAAGAGRLGGRLDVAPRARALRPAPRWSPSSIPARRAREARRACTRPPAPPSAPRAPRARRRAGAPRAVRRARSRARAPRPAARPTHAAQVGAGEDAVDREPGEGVDEGLCLLPASIVDRPDAVVSLPLLRDRRRGRADGEGGSHELLGGQRGEHGTVAGQDRLSAAAPSDTQRHSSTPSPSIGLAPRELHRPVANRLLAALDVAIGRALELRAKGSQDADLLLDLADRPASSLSPSPTFTFPFGKLQSP